MGEKIQYNVLGIYEAKIRELVENGRYRNPDDFIRSAIELLLTWESPHPEECFDLLRSLMPFSAEQEAFLKRSMFRHILQEQFGELQIDREMDESQKQEVLALSDDDYLNLRHSMPQVMEHARSLRITEPENAIPYDRYPLLLGFYSRILPVKIVLAVLGNLLKRDKTASVEISELRTHAYDIAEEISIILSDYEKRNSIPRNRKMSTGLPKKGNDEEDREKITMAQKRFKDQYVGKVRRSRITKKEYFEGALSALGLAYATHADGRTLVSLTELGKRFLLMENLIIQGRYAQGSLTGEESEFVLNELIPQRDLEKRFVDAAISVVRNFGDNTDEGGTKMTHVLNSEIRRIAEEYAIKNPELVRTHNISTLDHPSEAERKITQWRVATMGRLAELGAVRWTIDSKGDSVYTLADP